MTPHLENKMYTTSFEKLRCFRACEPEYNKLVCSFQGKPTEDLPEDRHLPADDLKERVITLQEIYSTCDFEYALWALRACEGPDLEKKERLFACWCAEQALPIWKEKFPDDNTADECIAAARRVANGQVEDLTAYRYAAEDYVEAMLDNIDPRSTKWDAVWNSARAARYTAMDSAANAAYDSAAYAFYATKENQATRDAQEKHFRRVFGLKK